MNNSSRGSTGSDELRLEEEKLTFDESSATPATFDKENGESGKPSGSGGTRRHPENCLYCAEQPKAAFEELFPVFESRSAASEDSALSRFQMEFFGARSDSSWYATPDCRQASVGDAARFLKTHRYLTCPHCAAL
jgi:hypothetical protein